MVERFRKAYPSYKYEEKIPMELKIQVKDILEPFG